MDNNCHRPHLEKKGIRVFGVAESYRKFNRMSTLAGVVMRRDRIIDGIVFGRSTFKGNDSTEGILSMFMSLHRNDVNCIMLGGIVISMYNIIDGEHIRRITGIPVIAITFEDSKGLEDSIRYHFPHTYDSKLEQYAKIGKRVRVTLRTGKSLFIRYWGLTQKQANLILDYFTFQGSVPEPIRIAKHVARAHI